MDLCSNARKGLYTSLSLVNRTWLQVFLRTAFTDVHITCEPFARYYLLLLRGAPAPDRESSSPVSIFDAILHPRSTFSEAANALCRNLTFHVDARSGCKSNNRLAIKLYSVGDSSAQAISSTLYMLDLLNHGPAEQCVPNLRRVTLEYFDWGFDDVFDQNRLMPLPKQVTDLRIRFRFSPGFQTMPSFSKKTEHNTRKSVLEDLRRRYELMPHPFGRFAVPGIQTLTVLGATTSFAAGMLEACPSAKTVTFDEHVELPVVPPWIDTVIIRDERPRANLGLANSEHYLLAARLTCGHLDATCPEDMKEILFPVAGQEHERARRRLKLFCANNSVRVVEI
ncbi:hypothetical protein BDW22DRAFT_1249125 [Trametopsis cervina]|nr:hypothetical protein BDW22DRAFT_1249125 [Trametopsis cervina]